MKAPKKQKKDLGEIVIADLNPSINDKNWTMKVKVEKIEPLRTYINERGTGKVLAVTFSDRDEQHIRSVGFGPMAEKFNKVFEVIFVLFTYFFLKMMKELIMNLIFYSFLPDKQSLLDTKVYRARS